MTERITNFYGQCLGTIETDSSGNKTVKDFYGRILGSYDSSDDFTRDFYGRIISKGTTAIGLIYNNQK